jgi:cell division protein FtsI (penicillin-binding protein 3)
MSTNRRERQRGVPPNVRRVMYSPSPLLASKTPPWRSKFLVALVGLSFCVLLGRAVYVQVINSAFFQKQGEIRYARTLDMPASRGRIVDRSGQLLAASVPAPSLWAIPKDVDADKFQRRQLAKLLGISTSDLEDRLSENGNFVWLRRQVDEPLAKDVLALKLKGVHQVREYKREYPAGESSVHVVGFTNHEEHGQEGIELAFDKSLAGRNGSRRVIKDRLGKVVEDIGESVASIDGHDVTLSLDSKVQFYAYQRLRDAVRENKAEAGSVVVLDARSGEVLALANYPSYTPADRSRLTQRQFGALARNRALTDVFEPGSTMKPFIAALALEKGRVTPDTVISTSAGRVQVSGITITDEHPQANDLTVNGVIQKSSNVGVVKMAMQMPATDMWNMFHSVGFGQKPQVEFPGTVTGRLRPAKTWKPIEQATMAYGYGLSTSLFQLARAYTAFANDGEVLPLSVVKLTQKPQGERVMSVKTARQVRHMLELAASEGGTAPKAQVMGYSVGGKTGTARKHDGSRYADKRYRAWFVGIAPIRDPRIVVAVMIDTPQGKKYFGGDVAAPVFSEVVQQTLRMMGQTPDLQVQPQILAAGTNDAHGAQGGSGVSGAN